LVGVLNVSFICSSGKRHLLSLAFDLVMILSLTGTMRSPLTVVCTTRGSLRVKSFDKAMTLGLVSRRSTKGTEDLLLSNLIVTCEVDGVLEPLAENDLQAVLAIDLNL